MNAELFFFILALLCFLLAAFGVSTNRVGLVPLGLAFCVLATIWPQLTAILG